MEPKQSLKAAAKIFSLNLVTGNVNIYDFLASNIFYSQEN